MSNRIASRRPDQDHCSASVIETMTKTLRYAVLMLIALAGAISWSTLQSYAQAELTLEADTMIQWGDYDVFTVSEAGEPGARLCRRACQQDQRCAAWTYIKGAAQCRLKHTVGNVVANKCCISGVRKTAASDNSRERFCADYATAAVENVDKARAERCGFGGNRWNNDYSAHYDWCLRTPKPAVVAETNARKEMLGQCAEVATHEDEDAVCDHYARVAVQQAQSNVKSGCGFAKSNRWNTDLKFHLARCRDNPSIADAEYESREANLRQCFERAGNGSSESDCNDYAQQAVAQVKQAGDSNCEFEESRRWSASPSRQYNWCQQASAGQRSEEIGERDKAIKQCIAQREKTKACDDYAGVAVEQSRKNANGKCGYKGLRWSLYSDDHIEQCMGQSQAFRVAERKQRDSDLARCLKKPVVGSGNSLPEICDRYAKTSVSQQTINVQKKCRLNEPRIWNADYSVHYDLCLAVTQEKRLQIVRSRNEDLRECGRKKGMQFELQFNFN